MPKENRIRNSKDFDVIYKEGKRIKTPYFLLVIREVKEQDKKPDYSYPRFGFIASKKVSKLAVTRNRAKRLLREAVRLNIKNISDSIEAILIAYPNTPKTDFEVLKSEVEKHLLS